MTKILTTYDGLKAKFEQDIIDLQMRCKHPKDRITGWFGVGYVSDIRTGNIYQTRGCQICGKDIEYKWCCRRCEHEVITTDRPPEHYYCDKCVKFMKDSAGIETDR